MIKRRDVLLGSLATVVAGTSAADASLAEKMVVDIIECDAVDRTAVAPLTIRIELKTRRVRVCNPDNQKQFVWIDVPEAVEMVDAWGNRSLSKVKLPDKFSYL